MTDISRVIERRNLTRADLDQQFQSVGHPAASGLKPTFLAHRNYFWLVLEGQGVIQEVREFDDGLHVPFDFLTVELIGWNFTLDDQAGNPAPFPIYGVVCNAGEIPFSHKFSFSFGIMDETWANGGPGKPWRAFLGIGFNGWRYLAPSES